MIFHLLLQGTKLNECIFVRHQEGEHDSLRTVAIGSLSVQREGMREEPELPGYFCYCVCNNKSAFGYFFIHFGSLTLFSLFVNVQVLIKLEL